MSIVDILRPSTILNEMFDLNNISVLPAMYDVSTGKVDNRRKI